MFKPFITIHCKHHRFLTVEPKSLPQEVPIACLCGPMWSNVVQCGPRRHCKTCQIQNIWWGSAHIAAQAFVDVGQCQSRVPSLLTVKTSTTNLIISCWFRVHHFSLGGRENISDSNMRTAKNSTWTSLCNDTWINGSAWIKGARELCWNVHISNHRNRYEVKWLRSGSRKHRGLRGLRGLRGSWMACHGRGVYVLDAFVTLDGGTVSLASRFSKYQGKSKLLYTLHSGLNLCRSKGFSSIFSSLALLAWHAMNGNRLLLRCKGLEFLHQGMWVAQCKRKLLVLFDMKLLQALKLFQYWFSIHGCQLPDPCAGLLNYLRWPGNTLTKRLLNLFLFTAVCDTHLYFKL